MFGEKGLDVRYEVIAIPFSLGRQGGVMTLQNAIPPGGPATRFAVSEPDRLKKLY
jgi:hypothetical protein